MVDGHRTVWCAQHDEETLEPAPARSYEKVSLSGSESVGVVRFLLGISNPNAGVVGAVDSAIRWFEQSQLRGVRQVKKPRPDLPRGYDKVVVNDPAAPALWARFYEIGSNRPIFCGRDGVIKYRLADIEHERRVGYSWYTEGPAKLLKKDYPAWKLRLRASASVSPANHYSRWRNGPPRDDSFFPIAVWLQNPTRAEQYRAAGFNTYVGLWKGPTDDQLRQLDQAGMKVVCAQNVVGLRHLDNPVIMGWMHGDEPDNAQRRPDGKGYGPPVASEKIIADYRRIAARDPSRPVLLNLGQGVAWDNWRGRGVRTNHPEDYPEYVKGCDIASFDIYPAVHRSPEVAGNLWFVAQGVQRLREWTSEDQLVWNCIECTRIHHPDRKASPEEVKAEVWMSIIHGSMGLIYFVHEWEPRFNEAALLDDPELLEAVTTINQRIHSLAPVLNSRDVEPGVNTETDNPDVPVVSLVKEWDGSLYVVSVALRGGQTAARIRVPDLPGSRRVEVLDEGRFLEAVNGVYTDDFAPWGVHLYRIPRPSGPRP